jgi:hypothetical protein
MGNGVGREEGEVEVGGEVGRGAGGQRGGLGGPMFVTDGLAVVSRRGRLFRDGGAARVILVVPRGGCLEAWSGAPRAWGRQAGWWSCQGVAVPRSEHAEAWLSAPRGRGPGRAEVWGCLKSRMRHNAN